MSLRAMFYKLYSSGTTETDCFSETHETVAAVEKHI